MGRRVQEACNHDETDKRHILYPGLGRPLEENLRRLEEAAELGITRLFLSFHIPETDPAAFDREVEPLLRRARSLGLETVGIWCPGGRCRRI